MATMKRSKSPFQKKDGTWMSATEAAKHVATSRPKRTGRRAGVKRTGRRVEKTGVPGLDYEIRGWTDKMRGNVSKGNCPFDATALTYAGDANKKIAKARCPKCGTIIHVGKKNDFYPILRKRTVS